MKKSRRRLWLVAVCVMLMTTFLAPTPVAAATYNWQTLGAGKSVGDSYKGSGNYTYYQIKVKKAGVLKFSFSGNTSVELTTSKARLTDFAKKGSWTYLSNSSYGRKAVAVEKGTYYLEVTGKGSVKYSFKSADKATNYSPAKAATLKKKKTANIVLTPKKNYDRWYKINVTKKQKIAITTNDNLAASTIEIYNKSLKSLETVKNGSDVKYCTKSKVGKGTYYIRVRGTRKYGGNNDYAFGEYFTLKWS